MFSLAAGMDVPYLLHCWAESKDVPAVNLKTEHSYRKITDLIELSKQSG